MLVERPIAPRIVRHGMILFLVGLVALALRGGLFLAVHGITLAVFLAFVLALCAAAAASIRTTEALYLPERHVPRMLWAVPMLNFGLLFGLLFAALWMPWRGGRPDYWKDLLDLPPTPLTHLVLLLFLLSMTHSLLLFLTLTRSYLGARMGGRVLSRPGDPITSLAAVGLLVILGGLAVYWRLCLPDNMRFFDAWTTLKLRNRPLDAVEKLAALVRRHPDSELVDNCLHRIARILDEDLSREEDAVAAYDRLLRERPDSPWCDDARLATARILARTPAHRPEAIRRLLEFVRLHGSSHLADDGLLLLARCQRDEGNLGAARRIYETLLAGYADRVWYDESPEAYPFSLRAVGELARRELDALGEDAEDSGRERTGPEDAPLRGDGAISPGE